MLYQTIEEFAHHLTNGRVLGIDFGEKKIGIALSDRERIIATPYTTITHTSINHDLAKITKIIAEFSIVGIVIGWPITMAGKVGDSCVKVEAFTSRLLQMNPLPIFHQDERLSTAAVNRILLSYNLSMKKKEGVDDQMSASYILQSTLDRITNINI